MSERKVCPPDHRHGENHTCYTTHSCRCDDCRELAREHRYWLFHHNRAGKLAPGAALDARGVRRRLEALMTLGWSMPNIADRVGVDRALVLRWLTATSVEAHTIARVSEVYEALSSSRPVTDSPVLLGIANRTRRIAAERGYLPPHWWIDIDEDDDPPTADASDVDIVAVELVVTGAARVNLTTAERQEAVRQMNARGYFDREIARMLGVSDKTVVRDRIALGVAAVDERAREALLRGSAVAA